MDGLGTKTHRVHLGVECGNDSTSRGSCLTTEDTGGEGRTSEEIYHEEHEGGRRGRRRFNHGDTGSTGEEMMRYTKKHAMGTWGKRQEKHPS
jgi:hypothetical protein